MARLLIPTGATDCPMNVAGRQVRLTNLSKVFWPDLGITKPDLLQYYADVSPALLPHSEGPRVGAGAAQSGAHDGRVQEGQTAARSGARGLQPERGGRTLASIYSVRPRPHAPVSTPVIWKELEGGIRIEDYRLDNVPKRLARQGDLWKPLLRKTGRFNLEKLTGAARR